MDRRTFLAASTAGLCGTLARPALASPAAPRAKSTILFFLCGGASHLDMWDLKPQAPTEYRGPFNPISTAVTGLQLSEHLPKTAACADKLAVLRSVGATVNTNDHHAGYYYHLTGHVPDNSFRTLGNNRTPLPDDWPFIGSVVHSKSPASGGLPNLLTLPHKPSRAPYTRPGQFAGRLGNQHDPLYVMGQVDSPLVFRAPALSLEGRLTRHRLAQRSDLLASMNQLKRQLDRSSVHAWTQQQQRAVELLTGDATTEAFDVSAEPESLRQRYGSTVNAMSLLIARRLVEAGVPFITVFWLENRKLASQCKSAGGWDTHGNNFDCLKNFLLPEFDQAYSALLEDLEQRGLLQQTLVVVDSEMGRKPKIGDPRSGGKSGAGRDHWTHCQSVVMAGGGIQGGQVFGSSDRLAEFPADNPVSPAHVAKTIYHAMGIKDLTTRDPEGRVFNLLESGHALWELF